MTDENIATYKTYCNITINLYENQRHHTKNPIVIHFDDQLNAAKYDMKKKPGQYCEPL